VPWESFAQQYARATPSDPTLPTGLSSGMTCSLSAPPSTMIPFPCAYLSEMDQGLYGGNLRRCIQYMAHPDNGWISSMVQPILDPLGRLNRHHHRPRMRGYRFYRRLMTTLLARAEGRFGISHFILIDGLNFLLSCLAPPARTGSG